jgi:hypothetical protein
MSISIIVDAGSTKIDWAIVEKNELIQKFHTAGWNARHDAPFPKLPDDLNTYIHKASNLYYYGAGVSDETVVNEIIRIFTADNSKLTVEAYSDLLAAARALYDDDYGIVGILGTGSNVAYYEDGKLLYKTPSLGYPLSDEGSGTRIGGRLLRDFFYKKMPEKVHQLFDGKYNLSKTEFLEEIYSKPRPNSYIARYTKFLSLIENDYKDYILQEEFRQLIELKILPHKNYLSIPIGFVGSVAHNFKSHLEIACKNYDIHNIKILNSPIDALVEYHKKKSL